ncbi:MAG: sulfoxide reductase heme-binding subunit YedZ, partial [Alteromonadaceae bacterium]
MALSFKPTVKDKVLLLKIIIHLSVVLPLINLYVAAFNDQLGADPVDAVIHFTGIGALNLLLITLTVSPIAKRFKLSYLLQTRRLLGLYAFSYAICHLINFLAFEVQFDMGLFFAEIFLSIFITVCLFGFLFFVDLV